MSAISDATGVAVETKRETENDAMAAQLTKEVALAGGALTVRGIPLAARLVIVDDWATKNGLAIAIIDA